jgi:hypothetical protein
MVDWWAKASNRMALRTVRRLEELGLPATQVTEVVSALRKSLQDDNAQLAHAAHGPTSDIAARI